MDNDRQDQAQRVNGDVSFSTGDLFPSIIATFRSSLGGANRLAIDDGSRGSRFLPALLAYFLPQFVVNGLPDLLVASLPKDSVNRTPIGIVFRQHPPLTSRANDIQNRIDDSPAIDRSATATLARRKQLSDHLPLPVAQIAGYFCLISMLQLPLP